MSVRGDLWRPIEQRELQYLKRLDFDALDRLLFVVLKVRADRSGIVPDSIKTLSAWSGLGKSRVKSSLASLVGRGLIVRAKHRATGGPRGYAWSWTTTVRPYAEWPTTVAEEQAARGSSSTKSTHQRVEEGPAGDSSSNWSDRKRGHRTKEEGPQNARRGATATRRNQESYQESYQELRTAYFVSSPEGQDGTNKEHAGDDGARPIEAPRRVPPDSARDRGVLNARGDGARALEILAGVKAARAASGPAS